MSRPASKPTESELQILAVLWNRKSATVREVHEHLCWTTGYTTTLKFMQIMTEKGLLLREKQGKSHIYRPATAPERMQKNLVSELVRRAFGGSVRKLLLAALSEEKTSPQELADIRRMLDEFESQRDAHNRPSQDSDD